MIINLSPQLGGAIYTLERQGDTLIIDGESFDFSPLQPGDELSSEAVNCPHFVGDIKKSASGELEVTLVLSHETDAPEEVRFPEPLTVTEDGPVLLPGTQA